MAAWRFGALLAALACAFWPVWGWFVIGTMDGSNDFAGLLAAASAVAMVTLGRSRDPMNAPLALPCVLTALYGIATLAGLTMPVRATLALLALAALASSCKLGRRLDPALAALCVLALPVAAGLQFYLGYPLRVLAGSLSAAMLRANGFAVVRDGAMLAWDGQLISIDAPCSGVKMLWAGLYLACALAGALRLSGLQTAGAACAAMLVVVAANAVRAAALFQVETGTISLPAYAHQGIGMIAFAGAALSIAGVVQWIKGRST